MDRDRWKGSVVDEHMASSWYGMKRRWIYVSTASWAANAFYSAYGLSCWRIRAVYKGVATKQEMYQVRQKNCGLRRIDSVIVGRVLEQGGEDM